MAIANKRLAVEIDRVMSLINKEAINPLIEELTIKDIEPIMKMVANARGAYLKELCLLTEELGDKTPLPQNIKKLRLRREVYEELVAAHRALDTAIERGYLDVKM